ncbi:MAG: hypothetical protein LBU34_05210 [Planctomycetaceae bacterium]|jgi:hypothetical protein|nr:hypothetical protein [Planctomycetaceae bacterium]
MASNNDDGCGAAIVGVVVLILIIAAIGQCNKMTGRLVYKTDDEGNVTNETMSSYDLELGKLKNQVDSKIKDLEHKYQRSKELSSELFDSIEKQIDNIKNTINGSDYEYGYASAVKRFIEGNPATDLIPAYNKWKLLVPDTEAFVKHLDWQDEIDSKGILADLKAKSKTLQHAITLNKLDIGDKDKKEILKLINTDIPGWEDLSSDAVRTNTLAVEYLKKEFQ